VSECVKHFVAVLFVLTVTHCVKVSVCFVLVSKSDLVAKIILHYKFYIFLKLIFRNHSSNL